MNLEIMDTLMRSRNAGHSTKGKTAGRPTTGQFYQQPRDTEFFWALPSILLHDAQKLAAYAAVYSMNETKFSAMLIEAFLREHSKKPLSDTGRVCAIGKKFIGEKQSKTRRWIKVGLTRDFKETALSLRSTHPTTALMTDYQLMSELLRLALVDFQVSIERDPAALNFSQEPTRTSPPELPQESSAPVLSFSATEIISITESTELDAEPLLDGSETEDLQPPVEPQASPEPTVEPKKASNFFKSGLAKKLAQKRAEIAANSSDTAAEVKTKRATVSL